MKFLSKDFSGKKKKEKFPPKDGDIFGANSQRTNRWTMRSTVILYLLPRAVNPLCEPGWPRPDLSQIYIYIKGMLCCYHINFIEKNCLGATN